MVHFSRNTSLQPRSTLWVPGHDQHQLRPESLSARDVLGCPATFSMSRSWMDACTIRKICVPVSCIICMYVIYIYVIYTVYIYVIYIYVIYYIYMLYIYMLYIYIIVCVYVQLYTITYITYTTWAIPKQKSFPLKWNMDIWNTNRWSPGEATPYPCSLQLENICVNLLQKCNPFSPTWRVGESTIIID